MTTAELNTPELRLPNPPGVFRRWLAAHPKLVDNTIVVTYLFGCALMIAFELMSGYATEVYTDIDPAAAAEMSANGAHLQWPWVLVSVLIVVATAFALAYRRRFPLTGLIVISLLLFLEQGLLVVPNSVALVFLLYAVPVYRSVLAGWIGLSFAVVTNTALVLFTGNSAAGAIGPAGIVASPVSDVRASITLAVLNALWLLAVLLIAINLGNRRRYIEALIDRAHQLAREREQRAQLAAAAERSRIAREMHDIVAHSLSVVVTLSEGASVTVQTKPEAAAIAMERAAETGRSALIEMRRLLGVLSETDGTLPTAEQVHAAQLAAPRAPQPGLAQLRELVDGFWQAGLRVSLTESGVPLADATQQLAVFRIVQEALTNSLRYAGKGAEASVTIAHEHDGTRIDVIDTGRATASAQPDTEAVTPCTIPGSGRGLAGAAERARMFGGSLEAAPHGRGWRVRAHVPGNAAPPVQAPEPTPTVEQRNEKGTL